MTKASDLQFLIVTPSYNQAHFIEETIGSVLSQRVQKKYVLMDGGSKDGTKEILKQYRQKLTFFSRKDRGQTDAINKGISYFSEQKWPANKTIFSYLNSDDYYMPGSLQLVAEYFVQHPKVQWVVGDCRIVDEHDHQIQLPVRFYKFIWRLFLSYSWLTVLNPIPQPAVFIRWKAVQKCGQFETGLHYVMDYQYWLRLWKLCGPPGMLNAELAAFRIHSQSKGGSGYKTQFAEESNVAEQHYQSPVDWWRLLHLLHVQIIILIYTWLKPKK